MAPQLIKMGFVMTQLPNTVCIIGGVQAPSSSIVTVYVPGERLVSTTEV